MTIRAGASFNARAAAWVRAAFPDVVVLIVLAIAVIPMLAAAAFAAGPLWGQGSSRDGLRLSAVIICLAAALVLAGCCGMALLRNPWPWVAIGVAVLAAAVAAALVVPDPSAPRSEILADVGAGDVITDQLSRPWTWPPLLVAAYGLGAAGHTHRRWWRDAFPPALMAGLFAVTLGSALLLAIGWLATGGSVAAGPRTFASYGLLALLSGGAAHALLRDRRWLYAGAGCFGVLTLAALAADLASTGASSPADVTARFLGWALLYPSAPLWAVVVLGLVVACLDPRSVWSDAARAGRPAAPAAPSPWVRWLDRADRATAWLDPPRRRR